MRNLHLFIGCIPHCVSLEIVKKLENESNNEDSYDLYLLRVFREFVPLS